MKSAGKRLQNFLQHAEDLCKQRGVRLTMQRRRVLQIIHAQQQPIGAYEILQQLDKADGAIAPPTVYRALDFLLQQGLIHRLQTLHAFVGCEHPEHQHSGQFLICTECGQVEELEDAAISNSLHHAAAASGFVEDQPVVEVSGRCANCNGNP